MRLIGVAIIEGDIGELIILSIPQLLKRSLEAAYTRKELGGYTHILFKPALESAFGNEEGLL